MTDVARVEVDKALCAGHALCWREELGFFPLDDDGYNAYAGLGPQPLDPELSDTARESAQWCPEQAIRLIE